MRMLLTLWMGCLLLTGMAVRAQEVHGPRISIEETAHDFGKVLEGQVIEHTFKIWNKGNAVLNIQKVRPD